MSTPGTPDFRAKLHNGFEADLVHFLESIFCFLTPRSASALDHVQMAHVSASWRSRPKRCYRGTRSCGSKISFPIQGARHGRQAPDTTLRPARLLTSDTQPRRRSQAPTRHIAIALNVCETVQLHGRQHVVRGQRKLRRSRRNFWRLSQNLDGHLFKPRLNNANGCFWAGNSFYLYRIVNTASKPVFLYGLQSKQ